MPNFSQPFGMKRIYGEGFYLVKTLSGYNLSKFEKNIHTLCSKRQKTLLKTRDFKVTGLASKMQPVW
jgi:hypothetical protein